MFLKTLLQHIHLENFNNFTYDLQPIPLYMLNTLYGDKPFYAAVVTTTHKELTKDSFQYVMYDAENLSKIKTDVQIPNGAQYIMLTLNIVTTSEHLNTLKQKQE